MGDFSTLLWNFLNHFATTTGATTALAVVCLIHYLWHLYAIQRVHQEKRRIEQELSSLVSEINDIQSERTLVRLENHLLREIVSHSNGDMAIQMLLRRFIVNPKRGMGVIIERQNGKSIIKSTRGLSDEPKQVFLVANHWWKRLKEERVIYLTQDDLVGSEWLTPFSSKDRTRIEQLFLVAIGTDEDVNGAMLITTLYPPGVSREQQMELVSRLMLSVSQSIKCHLDIETQKIELKAAKEMLDLRRITDKAFDSPTKMTDEFLSALVKVVKADRGALYLTTGGDAGEFNPDKARIRTGETLQPNLEQKWQAGEDRIVQYFTRYQSEKEFNQFDLVPLGVDTLIRGAFVSPLKQPHGMFGFVCLTKKHAEPFADWQKQLIEWACEHLSETMLRSLSYVAVERQARLDGLTQLSNRRTFDQMLDKEIEWAARDHKPCSLILIDLDRFKSINDNHGHQAGDDVLRNTANILKQQFSQVRGGDRVVMARYGGEELAVILPGMNAAGALRIAESIRQSIERSFVETGKGTLSVTASMGLSTFPEHASDVEGLISAADSALYHAKETGRNRVCQASESAVH